MKQVFFLLFGIISISIFFFLTNKRKDANERDFLTKLDLHLLGIVEDVDKVEGYNGTGVIRIKIINSNINDYDPRTINPFYYCIIKNGLAEIYDGNAQECNIGDTIEIDTQKKLLSWKNLGKENQKYTIWLNTRSSFYEYARKYHQKF